MHLLAVFVLVLIVVLILVVLIVVLVVILILILVLVIHVHFLQNIMLQPCRKAILPLFSAFILVFKDKTHQKTAYDGCCDTAGSCFQTAN